MGLWWKILRGINRSRERKYCTVWVVSELMCMEQWWNETDRERLKYWEKKLYRLVGRYVN
jgi:hypothetical protein